MNIKNKLLNVVKYNKSVYKMYEHVGNFGLHVLRTFIHQDPKMILITCFGGRKYDDSPKAVYEEMLKDERFKGYSMVWAFRNPEEVSLPGNAQKVKIDTFEYYKMMYRARVWLTNSGMERGLYFGAKNVFYVNTWHGTPIKKLGLDSPNEAFTQLKETPTNIWLAQSDYEANAYSSAFNLPKHIFRTIGYPRNDELSFPNEEKRKAIREKLGIPEDKQVVLYAPTYREFNRDGSNNCVLTPPIDIEKWRNKLSEKFVILFRAHYEVAKSLSIKDDDFIKEVSAYPNLNELMIASDILLSDYSSMFFDYSIMCKPMFMFAYDFEEYNEKRGLYFDIRKEIEDFSATEDEVIENLLNCDYSKRSAITEKFRNKYVSSYGSASKHLIELIYQEIK